VIVADASALLEVLLRTPMAATVEAALLDTRNTLHAPHLLDIEVAEVIRRYAAGDEIDAARGRAALSDLADFPLRRYPRFPVTAGLGVTTQLHGLRRRLRRARRSARCDVADTRPPLAAAVGHHARIALV
jgi:hypothetical protein